MSPSLPPEILDLIFDHLHDEPTTLRVCCLVSQSWIPRTRIRLFDRVEFLLSESTIESWMRTFPDPSNSPAHYTRSLLLSNFKGITVALPWIQSFNHIVELEVASWADNRHISLTRLCGLSPTLKYLRISHALAPLSEILEFICSFPLLEDLALCFLTFKGNADIWDAPLTSPKFTGSLLLSSSDRKFIRKLLDLPGGLHFSKITVSSSIGDCDLVNELVSTCSNTLESFCIGFYARAFLMGSMADQYLIAPRRCARDATSA